MPSFTLILGSTDLSPYVRTGPEDGFDPYGGGSFLEPKFSESTYGEGSPLTSVQALNREIVVPLYLNAQSKTALHALVQRVNNELRPLVDGVSMSPVRLQWQDAGATAPTYYECVFGRFESSFSMRHSERGWLAGTLRLYVRPYGNSGTIRSAGSYSFPSHPVGVITAASMLAALGSIYGDVSADLQIDIKDNGMPPMGRVIAVAPLPNPSYIAHFTPSMMFSLSALVRGPSPGLPGGYVRDFSVIGYNKFSPFTMDVPLPATAMVGAHRAMALVRGVGQFAMLGVDNKPVADYTFASSPFEFSLIDLGVVHVPEWSPSPNLKLAAYYVDNVPSVRAAHGFPLEAYFDWWRPNVQMTQVAGVYIMPDRETLMNVDVEREVHTNVGYSRGSMMATTADALVDGLGATLAMFTWPTAARLNYRYNFQISGELSIPSQTAAYTVAGVMGMGSMPNLDTQGRFARAEAQFRPHSSAGNNYRFGVGLSRAAAASAWIGWASTVAANMLGAEYRRGPSHGLYLVGGGGDLDLMPLSPTVGPDSLDTITIGFEVTPHPSGGVGVAMDIGFAAGGEGAGLSVFMLASGLHPWQDRARLFNTVDPYFYLESFGETIPRRPVAYMVATSSPTMGDGDYYLPSILGLRYTSWASRAMLPGDVQKFDQAKDLNLHCNPSAYPVRDRKTVQRGALHGISVPSAGGGIFVMSQGFDYTKNASLQVNVRVREKFTYSR